MWTDWELMPEMRFVRPTGTTTKPDVLQQKMVRLRLSDSGQHVLEREYCWQDVPVVITDDPAFSATECKS